MVKKPKTQSVKTKTKTQSPKACRQRGTPVLGFRLWFWV